MAAPQISGNPIDQDKTPGDGPGCEYVTFRGVLWIAGSLTVIAVLLLGLLLYRWPSCEQDTTQQAGKKAGPPSSAAATTTKPSPTPTVPGQATGGGTAEDATPGGAATEPAAIGEAAAEATEIEGTELDEVEGTEAQETEAKGAAPQEAAVEEDTTCKCSSERNLLWLVILAGALGGTLYALRSFYWYVGNRKLIRSWVPKYYFAPLIGALMAVTFFIVVRAGLSPDTAIKNCLTLVGIAVLVGLFSEEAAEKLKKIASAVLTDKPQGADTAHPRTEAPAGTPPVELILTPNRGAPKGGTSVDISGLSGADLTKPPAVLFGEQPAAQSEVVDGKILRVVTPPGSGEVDVSVTLASGQRLVKAKGFVYDPPNALPGNGGTGELPPAPPAPPPPPGSSTAPPPTGLPPGQAASPGAPGDREPETEREPVTE